MPRPETMRPFISWTPPNKDEIREVVNLGGGMTGTEIADYVGLPHVQSDGAANKRGRTVRKWLGGQAPIPYSVWCLLCHKAGIKPFWIPEQ